MYKEECFGADGTQCNITEYKDCAICPFYKTRKEFAVSRLKHIDKEREYRLTKDIGFNEKRFNRFVKDLEEVARRNDN